MVVKHHGKGKKFGEEQIFKQSDWGEDLAETMSYPFRELPTAYGCELGYLMDKTPRGNMAKVMLEEKFFKAWYKGRVVLTGDGKLSKAKKQNPSGRRLISRTSIEYCGELTLSCVASCLYL